MRGRAILILILAILPAIRILFGIPGEYPAGEKGRFGKLLSDRGKLTVTAVGLISHRENADGHVRLYVSDLTLIHEDTIYRDRSLKVLIYTDQTEPGALPGNYISCRGTVFLPQKATCPGQYDASEYLEASHIRYVIRSATIEQVYERLTWQGILSKIRWAMGRSYERMASGEDAGVLRALTLGEKGAMDARIRDLYGQGGISHILSISGTHIALVGMSLYRLLRRRRLSFLISAAVSGFSVFSFGMMTGFGTGAVRALIMFGLWLGAQVLGRSYDEVSAALLAGTIILLISPANLKQAGFWLSFGCILSIQLAGKDFERLLGRWRICRRLGVSLAVFAGTLPLVCRFFFQFSPVSALINLPVIFLMPVLMVLGLAGAFLGLFAEPAGRAFMGAAHLILLLFKELCEWITLLPFGRITTGCPPMTSVAAAYALFVFFLLLVRNKKIPLAALRAALLPLLAIMTLILIRPRPAFQVDFLDVGQGDCTLIRAGDTDLMVDGGSSTDPDVWNDRIESALKYYGVSELDAVFVTHGDLDHYSGISACLDGYGAAAGQIKIRTLVTGENIDWDEDLAQLARKAKECKVAVRTIPPGSRIRAGSLEVRCLFPSREECVRLGEYEDKNIRSLVLQVKYKDVILLLTGDLEREGERMLTDKYREEWAKEGGLEKIRILKCGHHGSRWATGEDLLDSFSPQAALISCGKDNRYGHPSSEVLSRLSKAGCVPYRSDRDGTVILSVNKGKTTMEVYTK